MFFQKMLNVLIVSFLLASLNACSKNEVSKTDTMEEVNKERNQLRDIQEKENKEEKNNITSSPNLIVTTNSEWNSTWRENVYYLYIQTKENETEIQQISLNRGNCQIIRTFNLPLTLKFGQTLKAMIGQGNNHCNVLEAEITTEKGPIVFTFQ